MRWLRAAALRLAALFNRERLERDFAAELESHVALHVDDNLRAGMTPAEARRQALLKLGGVAQVQERQRERRGVPALENLLRDLRFALRMLRRNPGFTATAVLTLGLGIGANTAIFSVVNTVLLRPLPFPHSERLMLVWATNEKTGDTEDVATYPDFEDWQAQSRSFERMAAFTLRGATISGADQAEKVRGLQATPGFFELLGAAPAIGRTFRPEESQAGAPRVAVLSDSAWRRTFGGRADVLGKSIRVNEDSYTIVGVMPRGFRFSFAPGPPEQIYVPLVRDPSRTHGFLRVLGRLRPDTGRAASQAEMDTITSRLAGQYPASNRDVGAHVVPLNEALVGKLRGGLLTLLGVVTLVLLIACTNVANLLLARSAARRKELALRAALGASRRRLLQQMTTESTVLAVAGGALGLLLAHWTARLLATFLAQNFEIPRIEGTATDGWVMGFAFLLSLATGFLFGAFFAPVGAGASLDHTLRESGRTATGGPGGKRLRSALIVLETALALVLLAGAGWLVRNLLVLRSTPPGFEPRHVLTAFLDLPKVRMRDDATRRRFFTELLARAEALPGVRSAALVVDLPLDNGWDSLGFHIPGRPDPSPDSAFTANFNIVSAGYFRTLGIALLAGREFSAQDAPAAPGAIVINETAARRFWPGENALGKVISLPGEEGTAPARLTVVGVSADVRQMGLGRAPHPEVYLCSMQPGPRWLWLTLAVRTRGEPATLAAAVKGLPRSVDRDVPMSEVRTLEDVLSASIAAPRMYTLLIGVFAALALILSAVGLYGVVAYSVTQRTAEMGVRMALGAERGAVVRLVLRQGMALALAGTAIGLAGGVAVGRLLAHLLPDAPPEGMLTLPAVTAVLLGTAFVAAWLPARRASRIDPTAALRYD